MELLDFLREESVKNRDAVREEAKQVREFFIATAKWFSFPLGVVIAVAAWYFGKSYSEMRSRLIDEQQIAIKQMLADQQGATKQMLDEQKVSEKASVKQLSDENDRALRQEFSLPDIQAKIDKAAEDAAQGEAGRRIQEYAAKAANDKINQAIAPYEVRAQSMVKSLHIQELIGRAEADDAKAFDELLEIKDGATPEQQEVIKGTISKLQLSVVPQYYVGSDPSKCANLAGTSIRFLFDEGNPKSRQDAIISCVNIFLGSFSCSTVTGQTVPTLRVVENIVPNLVKHALQDPSLTVRGEAFSAIDQILRDGGALPAYAGTGGGALVPQVGFDPLDEVALSRWWKSHESSSSALALLSFVNRPGANIDFCVELYEDLAHFRQKSPQDAEEAIELTLKGLRASASEYAPSWRAVADNTSADEDHIKRQGGCKAFADNLILMIQTQSDPAKETGTDSSAANKAFLLDTIPEDIYLDGKLCPADSRLIPLIGETALNATDLRDRYIEIGVINKWTGEHLDPFDSKSIQDWLTGYKSLHHEG